MGVTESLVVERLKSSPFEGDVRDLAAELAVTPLRAWQALAKLTERGFVNSAKGDEEGFVKVALSGLGRRNLKLMRIDRQPSAATRGDRLRGNRAS